MGKVVDIGCITKLDLPADRVLEAAKGEFEGVVLLGFKTDGTTYFASTYADGGTVVWLLELCKKQLLEVASQ
jgi:hypothetical protein